jgi:hypothetical protein
VLKNEKQWRYGQVGNAKYLSVVNPDTVTTTILQGPTLGHKDNPSQVAAFSFGQNMFGQTKYTDTRTQVPYNTPTMVSNSQPTLTTVEKASSTSESASQSSATTSGTMGFLWNNTHG